MRRWSSPSLKSARRDVPLYIAGLADFLNLLVNTPSTIAVLYSARQRPFRSEFEVNRYIAFERVQGWWGPDLPSRRGRYNVDTYVTNSIATATWQFEGFTARTIYSRESRSCVGDALLCPRPSRGPIKREISPDEHRPGAHGMVHHHPPRKFRTRGSRGTSSSFDFELTNKDHHVAPMRARVRISEFDSCQPVRHRPRSLKLLDRFATGAREVFWRRRSCRRVRWLRARSHAVGGKASATAAPMQVWVTGTQAAAAEREVFNRVSAR